jgi:hypothetical protein
VGAMVEKSIIIAGGGKFGEKAVQFAKEKKYNTLIIDRDPNCYAAQLAEDSTKNFQTLKNMIPQMKNGKILFFEGDIKKSLYVIKLLNPEYLIPVVPVHFMALLITEFLKRRSISIERNKENVTAFIENIHLDILLNSIDSEGVVYLSYAKKNEICPENCRGPLNYCPNFNREKPMTITKFLTEFFKANKNFHFNEESKKVILIIESKQLRGGLGGIPGSTLQLIISNLEKNLSWMKGNNFELTIATSCNCHGVVNFYKKSQ